ncbi:hypothetical protein C8J57DRAFT_172798 [Mycena rebaudengoi]|nr:hypothetical protein C8J57DRAFT_172798 [Mycena rebaudengoi]
MPLLRRPAVHLWLSCGDISPVVDGVLSVLSSVDHIKFPPVTSGVSVEAKLLDRLSDMLEDSSTLELHQLQILRIISNLASHESTAIAVVEANTLNTMEKLLISQSDDLYWRIFQILENLASHESTAMAVVRMLPLDLLGTLWRQSIIDTLLIDGLATQWEDLVTTKLLKAPCQATAEATCGSIVALACAMPQVVDGALWLLSHVLHLKFPPVTTGVSVEARLLTRIAYMLEASNTSEGNYPVIFQILYHLTFHNESSAVAIVEANVLNSAEKLLTSCPTDLYRHIFPMLAGLAYHESTATAVLTILSDLHATLWSEDPNGHKRIPSCAVIDLLTRIARWREGAEGMVAAKVLNDVLHGLHSLDPQIRLSTCELLRALVGHESMVQAVVAIVSREDIKVLSSDWDYKVRNRAAEILQIFDATLERIDSNSRNQ